MGNQYVSAMIPITKVDAELNRLVCLPISDLEETMSILLLKVKSHILSARENEFIRFLRKQLESYYRETTQRT